MNAKTAADIQIQMWKGHQWYNPQHQGQTLSITEHGPIMDLANGSHGQEILLFSSLSYFNMYSKEGHLSPFHNLAS